MLFWVLMLVLIMISIMMTMLTIYKNQKKYLVKTFFYYGTWNFLVISSLKVYVGDGGLTIYESFAQIWTRSLVHYGILMFAASAAMYIFCKYILRQKMYMFIKYKVFCLFVVLSIYYLVLGKITNIAYCLIWGISFVLTIILCRVKKETDDSVETVKIGSFCKKIVPYIVFVFVSNVIFPPCELYLSNVNEFLFPFWDYFSIILLYSCILSIVYFIGMYWLIPSKWLDIYVVIIFGITFLNYLQGNILNGSLGVLDGSKQTWSVQQICLNIVVWVVVAGVIFTITYKGKAKIFKYICAYIALVQCVTLVILGVQSEKKKQNQYYTLTTDSMLELGTEENTIVFVLDWYDNQILNWVLEADENFLQPLQDFTWYQDVTSKYAFTEMSIPYLLTGIDWTVEEEADKYRERIFSDNENVLSQIYDAGYEVGIYTSPKYVSTTVKDQVVNYSKEIEYSCNFTDVIEVTNKSTRYKNAPFLLKSLFWYSTNDIDKLTVSQNVFDTTNDVWFYQDLKKKELKVKDTCKKAYRFYHLWGAHVPCNMNDKMESVENGSRTEQAIGDLKIVFEYIDQMKKLGVYDNATIIITADHGQNTVLNIKNYNEHYEDRKLQETSSPILFVKQPQQRQDNIRTCDYHVSHKEVVSSIADSAGVLNIGGKNLQQIDENDNKVRYFEFYRNPDIPYTKYAIEGNAMDVDSWSIVQ